MGSVTQPPIPFSPSVSLFPRPHSCSLGSLSTINYLHSSPSLGLCLERRAGKPKPRQQKRWVWLEKLSDPFWRHLSPFKLRHYKSLFAPIPIGFIRTLLNLESPLLNATLNQLLPLLILLERLYNIWQFLQARVFFALQGTALTVFFPRMLPPAFSPAPSSLENRLLNLICL